MLELIIYTPNFSQLLSFYSNLGCLFHIEGERAIAVTYNLTIRIILSELRTRTLFLADEVIYNPLNISSAHLERTPSLSKNDYDLLIIPVLRSPDIHAKTQTLAHLGNWQQEQHHTGPVHYALANPLLEVYPSKNNKCEDLELAFVQQAHSVLESSATTTTAFDADSCKIIVL